ncbi:PilC/PilY family type IV pilus protein [Marinimicrobium sp. C6131]|uniref:pilus assembly protein n=1 Tax=Marinimicrobium sp. C6131 TaxID=3022676 RepID=UPI00223E03D9|nr:PilC/PilY family type IV pilus protein [Marinimicrobium sp. C6131]UZJ44690.1 PilC/PilY family type IV pilus protein [Marinimicrobium sp. C6131]
MNMNSFQTKGYWSLLAGFLAVAISHSVAAVNIANDPLFLQQPVRPIVMLNMSNDHQLFFKAYDDYSDRTGDGNVDNTYVHDPEDNPYYGYFDSDKCYTYNTTQNRYDPSRMVDSDGYCNAGVSNEWSGNFLNWASMTRMDAVRKILYGGLRSTDTADTTVLERAFLPQDAHSFAKYYNKSDLGRLTPFGGALDAAGGAVSVGGTSPDSGITICNTTEPSNRNQLSQNVDAPPIMRVARGNFSLWASNERWQCRWGQGSNDNNSTLSGINAYSSSPGRTTRRLGGRDFNVRVRVCDASLVGPRNNENCRAYTADGGEENLKPSGLLQEFGEDGRILYGLMTGSYAKNKSGGVLRKNVGDLSQEINDDGTFVRPEGEGINTYNGIISTLDRLRIYGYRFDDGTYHRGSHGFDNSGSDGCLWSRSAFSDGHCSNWGNPQSEIYLESLRYLGGFDAQSDYDADDSSYITGLNTADWVAPVTNDNYCAPLNVIQFNASTSSYDGDLADGVASDIGLTSINAATNSVGSAEDLHGKDYFVGAISGAEGANADQLCTPKRVNGLADVRGTCPDAPRLDGSYKIAGLAYHARTEGISLKGVTEASSQEVLTYGVTLAPAIPQVSIPVPGSTTERITLLPACRNTNSTLNSPANCALVDFKVVEQDVERDEDGNETRTGKLYVNWEDSEQGGDFDQDMWGIIEYAVTADKVDVTTQVIAQSTGDPMGFGYVIGGTEADGFHVHSGVNGFRYTSAYPDLFDGCGNTDGTRCSCRVGSGFGGTAGPCNYSSADAQARTQSYEIGSSAELLQPPLYYAAKWGGFAEDVKVEDVKDGDVESYYFATDPKELEDGLRRLFGQVEARIGSAASVATNSTNLTEGSFVFQARFNSEDWSGELLAFEVGSDNSISDTSAYSTDATMRTSEALPPRRIISVNEAGDQINFQWSSLSAGQQALLNGEDGRGEDRLRWLWGSNANETATGGLRQRPRGRALGDIVNSSPVYLGERDRGYRLLGGTEGSRYAAYLRDDKREQPHTLFVGANDGMLHAFDVENDVLRELFAYVPGGVYDKLANISKPNYGSQDNPHKYTVDGPLAVGDAYFNDRWRSVVVGTLGGGGKGVFALDVTNRNNPQVIFELNGDDVPGLGHVMGAPLIVKMADGKWAAVFGNGYGSDSNSSQLFVVDFDNPDSPTVLDAGAGRGLSGVALLGNAYGQVQAAYAGDLQGNLWKFDLSGSNNRNGWGRVYGGAMFQARDENGNPQPIFGAPTLGRNDEKGNAVMVYFGTGKYFEINDNNVTANDPDHHSFYAIADTNTAHSGDRTSFLHQRFIQDNGTTRVVNDGTGVDWTADDGWFMDFSTRVGERVINKPLLLYDKLIFPTIIPSATPCQFGGQSWLMELPAVGNRNVGESILAQDGENPNQLNDSLILGDPTHNLVDNETGKLISSTSDGSLREDDTNVPKGTYGRQSWRQLR